MVDSDFLIASNPKSVTIPRLFIKNVTKSFPGVLALDDVNVEIAPGEIHALVGENGAGKSTMMHIIAGVYRPNQGVMEIDGKEYSPSDEKSAQNAGVAMVFQEGSLFPPLSIAENIFPGRQPANIGGMIQFEEMNEKAGKLLADLDVDLDPRSRVASLSPSQKQLVEIAKALSLNVRILILDEPTSSLTINEARHLFKILRKLSENGVSIIYVTHRLAEVFEVSDRVTVLKDGKISGVRITRDTNADELIHMEVGRELFLEPSDWRVSENAQIVLEIEGLAADPVTNAALTVHEGEIVCLAGLVGAGRTELCEAIFGIRNRQAGIMRLSGDILDPHHPYDAMECGIGMVTEDRREAGLFLAMSVESNILAGNMDSVSKFDVLDRSKVRSLAQNFVESLHIVTPSVEREVLFLSGGNQQKVLLARWLARKPKLLIVDEPTRGVDVGAKSELYKILRDLAKSGVALLVVSSDLPEVLALAHKIVVMSEGSTVGEMDAADADEVTILQMATPKSLYKQSLIG